MSLAVAGLPANKMAPDPVASSNPNSFSLKGATSSNSAPVSEGGALAQVNLCAGPDEPDPSTFAHLSYMTTFGSPDRQRDAAQALEALREQMTEDPRGNVIFAFLGNEPEDFGLENMSEFILMAHAEGLIPEGTTIGIDGYRQEGRIPEMRELAQQLNMPIAFGEHSTPPEYMPDTEAFRNQRRPNQDRGAYVIYPDGESGFDTRARVDIAAPGSRCETQPRIIMPERP